MTAADPERARELFADYVARREGGEGPSLSALVDAHPELASEIERLHRAWQRLERGLAGFASDSVGGASASAADAWLDEADARRIERLGARGAGPERYRVERELGRGGMGRVHEVIDLDLERPIAMKVAELAGLGGSRAKAARLARFLREARITGRLQHPAIVPVHELGMGPGGEPYFTMPLVRGHDLRAVFEWTRDGRDGWSRTRALGVLLEVCNAVAYAHSRGVVHRDLKPANVMVGEYGAVHVVDWGLAKRLGESDAGEPGSSARSQPESDGSRTRDGEVLGTPAYMPPEQARGGSAEVDERADVYAIGAILYHLLAHVPPYADRVRSGQTTALVHALLSGPPTPVAALAAEAPAELVAICERAMARDRRERYASASALGDDLRAWLEGRVVSAHDAGAFTALRKWIARNRALAAALGLVLVGAPLLASLATYVAATRDEVRAAEDQARAQQVESLLEEGFLELGEGDPRRARASFDAAAAFDPRASEAWAGATLAELASGAPEHALATLDEAARRGADLAELDLLRAEALRALGREDEARALEADAGEPATPAGCYVLAERDLARIHRGETADAERAARLMLRAVQRSRAARPLYWYGLAHARGHAGEPVACEEVAEVLTALWPDEPGARHWTGFALSSTDDPARAIPHFEAAVAAEPARTVYRYGLARELAGAGETERALAIFRALAAEERPPAAVHDQLSMLLSRIGEHEQAIAAARAGVQAHPDRARSHQSLADAMRRAGEREEAERSFEAAVASAPDDRALRRVRALNLSDAGRHAEALAELESMLASAPDDSAARADYGIALEAAGELERSREAFEEALRVDPRNPTALVGLGRRAMRVGEIEAALGYYRAALEVAPAKAIPAYNAGCAFYALGRIDEAIEAFRTAVEHDPFLAEAQCNLGHALRERGRFEEALAALRRGHELGSKKKGWGYESADWVREVEALIGAAPRIDALLAENEEATAAQRAELAGFALELDRAHDAALLYERALDEDPSLGSELDESPLLRAARAAARAAQDASREETRRAELRALAFAWLDRYLFELGEALESGALPAGKVRVAVQEVQRVEELAPLRDEAALGALAGDEADGLRELWAAFAELEARASERSGT